MINIQSQERNKDRERNENSKMRTFFVIFPLQLRKSAFKYKHETISKGNSKFNYLKSMHRIFDNIFNSFSH